jgi:RHS repeat-associated protein
MRTGTLIAANSGYANDNPFRFSTKWLDDELAATGQTGAVGEEGLYYYGYRYLSTTWGRWLNEDPIEEQGGLNLYAFVGNEPVNGVDALGLMYVPGYPIADSKPTFVEDVVPYQAESLLKRASISTLDDLHRELQSTVFGDVFGFTGAVYQVRAILRAFPVKYWRVGEPAYAQQVKIGPFAFGPWLIYLKPTSRWTSVFHEGIHRWNNVMGKAKDLRVDEGIATGAVYLLTESSQFANLEQVMNSSSGCLSDDELRLMQTYWVNGWRNMWRFLTVKPSLFPQDTLDSGDLNQIAGSLGIRISCSRLADHYNKILERKGLTCPVCSDPGRRAHCFKFVCRPKRGLNNEFGTEKLLHPAFK